MEREYNRRAIVEFVADQIGRAGRGAQTRLKQRTGASQPTVSNWATGKHAPDEVHWSCIEQVLGLEPGAIAAAGSSHVGRVSEVEAALLRDPTLTPLHRRLVLQVYRELRAHDRGTAEAAPQHLVG